MKRFDSARREILTLYAACSTLLYKKKSERSFRLLFALSESLYRSPLSSWPFYLRLRSVRASTNFNHLLLLPLPSLIEKACIKMIGGYWRFFFFVEVMRE